MKLVESWRLTQAADLFPAEDPIDHLVRNFPRLAAYYDNVRQYGDTALGEYLALDGLDLEDIKLSIGRNAGEDDERPDELPDELDEEYLAAVEQAITRIINFYQHQRTQSWFVTPENDEIIGQKYHPIERVAVLMPRSWKAAPITLLMSIIPAIIAGVKDIYINLPPTPRPDAADEGVNPLFLWICHKLGIANVFRIPEVPAVFAFALGTATVPRVDKIVGAGGLDVQAAAAIISPSTGVKILSDRNYTVILADGSASERYIAADIFAVAEDPNLHRIVIVTTSTVKATEIAAEISRKLAESPHASGVKEILSTSGAIVLVKDIEEALTFIHQHPPKHLSIFAENPLGLLAQVRNAGVLYLGDYSPAGMENYFATSSNLIPSGRACRFSSPLDCFDFLKKTSVVHYSKKQVEHVCAMINTLADKDNLPFHRESFRIRMEAKEGPLT